MWYTWALLVASALLTLVEAGPTTHGPPRTLDRKGSELAWRSWLQSAEQSNPNTPPRRITTKSLFITPLVCREGQRLERDGCVQIVTVNEAEHAAILLEELQKKFTAPPSEIQYDYGDLFEEQQGPVQVSIPIGFDPQAQPLQSQDGSQAQELRPDYFQTDKREELKDSVYDASVKAEQELHKLPHTNDPANFTVSSESNGILNHNVLNNNFIPLVDKLKRDNLAVNASEENLTTKDTMDEGQKEIVFGQVNIDPVLYHTEELSDVTTTTEPETEIPTTVETEQNTIVDLIIQPKKESNTMYNMTSHNKKETANAPTVLKTEQNKLNPENEYADIGEAIKLISRYASVTTDDNFSKDQKKYAFAEDDILGTRTKQQYRRNKPKSVGPPPPEKKKLSELKETPKVSENTPLVYSKGHVYYRYAWPYRAQTQPPDFPFRRLQDYWPNWKQTGGVYNMGHENPKRHHHSYPHNGLRTRSYGLNGGGYPGLYPSTLGRLPAPPFHAPNPAKRPRTNNQDLYSLLGLRHWISSESSSKR